MNHNDGIPCFDCDKECDYISMTQCEKLFIYLKIKLLDRDSNETEI